MTQRQATGSTAATPQGGDARAQRRARPQAAAISRQGAKASVRRQFIVRRQMRRMPGPVASRFGPPSGLRVKAPRTPGRLAPAETSDRDAAAPLPRPLRPDVHGQRGRRARSGCARDACGARRRGRCDVAGPAGDDGGSAGRRHISDACSGAQGVEAEAPGPEDGDLDQPAGDGEVLQQLDRLARVREIRVEDQPGGKAERGQQAGGGRPRRGPAPARRRARRRSRRPAPRRAPAGRRPRYRRTSPRDRRASRRRRSRTRPPAAAGRQRRPRQV